MMQSLIPSSWRAALAPEFSKPYWAELEAFLRQREADGAVIYPPRQLWFNALSKVEPGGVKIFISGQDPYHNEGEAMGLSFSVPPGVKVPSSLRNILKEAASDLGRPANITGGDLTAWASQGTLLLNATLTVEHNDPAGHAGKGWEQFTDAVLQQVNAQLDPVVFILWGNHARKKAHMIDTSRHFVIESAHPSGLSAHRGFFGSKPFSRANAYLQTAGLAPLDW